MYKLVILIEPPVDQMVFDAGWPDFLRHVESMPGLVREATSRVERWLYGPGGFSQVQELFFETLAQAEQALASPPGQAAGRRLQQLTGGRMVLFLAEHKEDDLANILKYRSPSDTPSPGGD